MPAARAASSREDPSSPSARASIRRAARASRHRAASRRSSTAPGSCRVTATVMAPPPIGYTADQRPGAARGAAAPTVRSWDHWYYWRIRAGRGFHFRRRKLGVGRTTAPFLVLLGALSWTVGSALGELAARVAPGRALRLRYEDLCRDPAGAVRAVGAAF